MNKSTNKYRHKWVEPFDAPFTYICSKCGKHKIKETMYTATYYDENMNPLGSKSPECVSKQPSILTRNEENSRFIIQWNWRSGTCCGMDGMGKSVSLRNK